MTSEVANDRSKSRKQVFTDLEEQAPENAGKEFEDKVVCLTMAIWRCLLKKIVTIQAHLSNMHMFS